MLSTICIRMFVDMSSFSKKDSANLFLFIGSWLWRLMLNRFLAISFQRIVMLLINLHTVNTSLCNLETVSMSNLQLFLHQSFLLDHTITYSNTSRLLRYLLDIGNHIKICFWWDLKYYCNNNNIYQEFESYSLEQYTFINAFAYIRDILQSWMRSISRLSN